MSFLVDWPTPLSIVRPGSTRCFMGRHGHGLASAPLGTVTALSMYTQVLGKKVLNRGCALHLMIPAPFLAAHILCVVCGLLGSLHERPLSTQTLQQAQGWQPALSFNYLVACRGNGTAQGTHTDQEIAASRKDTYAQT